MIVGIFGDDGNHRAAGVTLGKLGHDVRRYGRSPLAALLRLFRERPRPDLLIWLGSGGWARAGARAERWLDVPGVWFPQVRPGIADRGEVFAASQARRVVVSNEEEAETLVTRLAARTRWQAEFVGPRLVILPEGDGETPLRALDDILRETAAPAPRVWMVSPAPWSRGGVADVARQVLVSPLSRGWRMSAVPTYVTGSTALRLWWALRGTVSTFTGLLFHRPDLVHLKVASRGSFARKLMVTALCRLRGVPVLVHIHGGGFDQFVSRSSAPVRRAARWMVEEAPLVLSLSERWAEKLRALFPRALIEAIPNPVETSRYADIAERRLGETGVEQGNGMRHAVFLGDILERKGVFDLLEAWPTVVKQCPTARLSLAGTGDLARATRVCESAGIRDAVDVLGWVGFEQKHELFEKADIFVLPSYIEGVPISLLEAMAAGLPSVVTPVGGVPDAATDGKDAIFVNPGDRDGMAQAIVELLADSARAKTLALAARQSAARFDICVYADQLDDIYRCLLRGKGVGIPETYQARSGVGEKLT